MKRYKIITAGRNCGKTTFIRRAAAEDCKAAGFLSEKEDDGYCIVNIREHSRVRLLTDKPEFIWRFRRWYINENAFHEAFRYISSLDPGTDRLYIDEIGLLECEGRGFAPVLRYSEAHGFNITVTIRDSLIPAVIENFPFLKDAEISAVPPLPSPSRQR